MNLIEIELESVGYYAKGVTQVIWYECIPNDTTRRAAVIAHYVEPKSCKREGTVNHLRFEVEEGRLYKYRRSVCVKSRVEEERSFTVSNGVVQIDENATPPDAYYHGRGYAIM